MPVDPKAWIKPAAYISLASLSCILFTAYTPPLLSPASAAAFPIVGGLPYEGAAYWIRFALSFALLGAAPAALAFAFGESPASLGLAPRVAILREPLFWLAVPAAAAVGAVGALAPDIGAYYPYARDLPSRVRDGGLSPLALHFAAYLVLYYLPWEFFFRGFLLLPLAAAAERAFAPGAPAAAGPRGGPAAQAAIAACVLFQTLPSTMLHVGHPLSELASAIPAGLVLGVLAWRTRSIFPGLILHAAVGFGTDAMAVLRGGGYL